MIDGSAPPVVLTAAVRWARARQAALTGAMLTFAALANPDRPLPFDVCLWHRLTGLPCLTCGMTRAVCYATHGLWAASIALHPAGILVLAGMAAWGLWSAAEAVCGESIGADVRAVAATSLLRAALARSTVIWIVRLVTGATV